MHDIFTLAIVIMIVSIKVKIINCCKLKEDWFYALDACLHIAGLLFYLRLVDNEKLFLKKLLHAKESVALYRNYR